MKTDQILVRQFKKHIHLVNTIVKGPNQQKQEKMQRQGLESFLSPLPQKKKIEDDNEIQSIQNLV